MQRTLSSLVWTVCWVGPLAFAVFVIFWKRRQWHSRRRHPFGELRRRPAGESLRLKIVKLDDEFLDVVFLFVGVPAVCMALGPTVYRSGWLLPLLALLASAGWTAIFGSKIYRNFKERSDYQLGFDGERYVGEELTQLVAEGFEIYHDVPFEDFNIDHVLVGPPGVFAVETKTRRKPVGESRTNEYRVEFDGTHVLWSWGADARGVQQSINNARTLARWLGSAVGESVFVIPILTLPGWWIDRKAPPSRVHVVNPKEIIKVCDTKQTNLNESLIRRICHQLDQKCRVAVG